MTHQVNELHCTSIESKLDIIFFIFLTNYYLWFQTTWIQITLNYSFQHGIDTNRTYGHLGLCFKRFIYWSYYCFDVSTDITWLTHVSIAHKTMYFLNWMNNLRLQFKATPFHSYGDYRAYLWRCECSNDYIREVRRIFGLDLNVQIWFWIDVYLWYKFESRLFFFLLKKPAKYTHV